MMMWLFLKRSSDHIDLATITRTVYPFIVPFNAVAFPRRKLKVVSVTTYIIAAVKSSLISLSLSLFLLKLRLRKCKAHNPI